MGEGEARPGEFLVTLSWLETVPGAGPGQTRDLVYGSVQYFEVLDEAQRFRASSNAHTGWVPTGAHSPEVSWVQRTGRRSIMAMAGPMPRALDKAENARRMGELAAAQRRHAQAGTTQADDPERLRAEVAEAVARWWTQRRDGTGMPATTATEEAEARAGYDWRLEGPSPVGVARQPALAPSPDEPF